MLCTVIVLILASTCNLLPPPEQSFLDDDFQTIERTPVMQLTPEQKNELARFPAELRAVIEAELAAGNTIEEVGHSHPAPPAGAYFKFTKKVTTHPHAAGKGITFRERNSSISSGEFGDPTGFFFIVEPPGPPPEPIDMDAIRRSLEPKPNALTRLAQRAPRVYERKVRVTASTRSNSAPYSSDDDGQRITIDDILAEERETGVRHELFISEEKSPEQMQVALERELMVILDRRIEKHTLFYRAKANVNGCRYEFEVEFLGIEGGKYFYRLMSDASWAHLSSKNEEYFCKVSNSWITMWTRELNAGRMKSAPTAQNSTPQYREACDHAMQFESNLDSVEAIQQEIVAKIKKGGRYTSSHKEGGSNIRWRGGKFVRDDYGDYPDHIEYKDEADFLAKLKMFLHWDVARNYEGQKISDLDAWRLMLRRLRMD
ncbi:MAG: hypothetical protein U0640_10500 [Phycisphaerales bacterium]